MNFLFYVSALVAVVATVMVLTRAVAVHALLYFIVSLLAVALVFLSLGAAFVAALEVVIYAGAIMVLFVFVVMMLNLSDEAQAEERRWWRPAAWIGPGLLALILLAELIYALAAVPGQPLGGQPVDPQQVGLTLFGPYLLGVEIASMVLLAGLVGAYHLGLREAAPAGQLDEAQRFGAVPTEPGHAGPPAA